MITFFYVFVVELEEILRIEFIVGVVVNERHDASKGGGGPGVSHANSTLDSKKCDLKTMLGDREVVQEPKVVLRAAKLKVGQRSCGTRSTRWCCNKRETFNWQVLLGD